MNSLNEVHFFCLFFTFPSPPRQKEEGLVKSTYSFVSSLSVCRQHADLGRLDLPIDPKEVDIR